MTFHILLPFYGRPDHFRLAVESVLAQTDPDWALTVVDDVYPDTAPGEWLLALGDPRIEYHRNARNLGVSRNYMACVTLMRGQFSMMLGCDDILLPGFVARVTALLAERPEVSILQPGTEVIDADGRVYLPLPDRLKAMLRLPGHGPRVASGERLAASLLRGNWTYFPSIVWRVDALKAHGFHPDMHVVQDLIMLLDIIADGGEMLVDDEVVFQYRRHRASVSAETAVDGTRFRQEQQLFAAQVRQFEALGWPRAAAAGRRHWTSRLNALTNVPSALRVRNASGVRTLLRHALARD